MISSCKTLKETRWCLSHFHIVNIIFITFVSHAKFHIIQRYTSIISDSSTSWCCHPIITLTGDQRRKRSDLNLDFGSLTFALFRWKTCMKFPLFPSDSSTGFNGETFALEDSIFPISSGIGFFCDWLIRISNETSLWLTV